jgi:hypothetical protein
MRSMIPASACLHVLAGSMKRRFVVQGETGNLAQSKKFVAGFV